MQTMLHSCDSGPLERPIDTNLSASRMPDGNSENAASILAVDSPDIGRSDSGAEVIDALTHLAELCVDCALSEIIKLCERPDVYAVLNAYQRGKSAAKRRAT